jgi:Nucleotide-diphospho-sugar transferase
VGNYAETIRNGSAGLRGVAQAGQPKEFLRNTVMYTLATAGYVPFVLNLHESMKRVGMAEHLVVYTPSEAVQQELQVYGLRCPRFGKEELPEWGDWFTPEFARIVALKFAIASEILASGRNALYVDADIVFLRNPASYLQEVISRSAALMIMQYEAPKNLYNTGFWFARPHPMIIRLFGDTCWYLMHEGLCDQMRFNGLVLGNGNIEVEGLDPELFACGNQFLGNLSNAPETIDRSTRPFDFRSAYMLHFNYLVGKRAKINAMREHNSLFYSGLLGSAEVRRPLLARLAGFIRRAG